MKNAIIILLFLSSFNIFAGELKYNCKIHQIMDLTDNGKIVKHKGINKISIGEKFTIDRLNGYMIGSPFSTRSYKEIKVLSRGSTENSFKSIVISHPPNIWIMYIQVKEFIKGKYKPFIGLEGSSIFSGQCE